MNNDLFVLILGILSFLFLGWGFRSLTAEKWQIALATPSRKLDNQFWKGTNYTYYGLLQAMALMVGVSLLYALLGSLDISYPRGATAGIIIALAFSCLAASRIIATLVERKKHTLSVGGAFFVGLLIAPLLILGVNRLVDAGGISVMPVMPFLAAISVAYVMGEGLGRLACISFGCCYGKPVSRLHPFLQSLFRRHNFVFSGSTKKIAYEAGLDNKEVVPIQAITSAFLVLVGLVSVYLYLKGSPGSAFLVATICSQAWRCISETLRADYRGGGRVSAYQTMSVVAICYAIFLWMAFPYAAGGAPQIEQGLTRLWDPAFILILQLLGGTAFLFTGRSSVTESLLTIVVREDRV